MSYPMIFEDGQGNLFNEEGVAFMEVTEEEETPFGLETLTTMTEYLDKNRMEEDGDNGVDDTPSKEIKKKKTGVPKDDIKRHVYSDRVREQFFELKTEKLLSTRAAALNMGINPRTAQKCVKAYKDSGCESLPVPKEYKRGRKPVLQKEHKSHLIEFIDENPSAGIDQMVESLTKEFEGLQIKKTAVHQFVVTECNISFKMARKEPAERNSELTKSKKQEWIRAWEMSDMDFMRNCIFIDEAGFHINMKRSQGWAKKRETPVVVTPTTRAISTTIIGAICSAGVVNLSLRKPKAPSRSKKRKTVGGTSENSLQTYRGTVTGHYLKFLTDT
ncbi:hypothetical protein BDB01DRAFT_856051 [Pilobolus umbonatus]|nr:hypothetical protein BDB01DRAFT_856051 [Pilobolus umbonatus]